MLAAGMLYTARKGCLLCPEARRVAAAVQPASAYFWQGAPASSRPETSQLKYKPTVLPKATATHQLSCSSASLVSAAVASAELLAPQLDEDHLERISKSHICYEAAAAIAVGVSAGGWRCELGQPQISRTLLYN